MVTTLDSLVAINAYPIPKGTIESYASIHRLPLDVTLTEEVATSREYRLTKAEIYLWLSYAPNVSQGGVTYNLSDEQRQDYRNQAKAIFAELGDNSYNVVKYGYKGSRL